MNSGFLYYHWLIKVYQIQGNFFKCIFFVNVNLYNFKNYIILYILKYYFKGCQIKTALWVDKGFSKAWGHTPKEKGTGSYSSSLIFKNRISSFLSSITMMEMSSVEIWNIHTGISN